MLIEVLVINVCHNLSASKEPPMQSIFGSFGCITTLELHKDLDKNFSIFLFTLSFLVDKNSLHLAKLAAFLFNFFLKLLVHIFRTHHVPQDYDARFGLVSHKLLHDKVAGILSLDGHVLLLLERGRFLTLHELLLQFFLLLGFGLSFLPLG